MRFDTRFTYFQEPVRVEDVLGRVFPFASECSLEALNAEIRVRFKQGPGRPEVLAGEYEISNAKDSNQVLSIANDDSLLPGMSITMAIIMERRLGEEERCPRPGCLSRCFVGASCGGRTW